MKLSKNSMAGLITVRVSSKRLPGKCLLQFGDGNILNHMIRRARFFGIEPIVCTSTDSADDVIERVTLSEGAKCFRGSLVNKLKRWSDCASYYGLSYFHTLDADDPFFDGIEVFRSMNLLVGNNLDMVYPTASSSAGGASVGFSLTSNLMKRALKFIPENTDTEMAWHYLEKVPDLRCETLLDLEFVQNNVRLTLDYQEDYWMLESLRRILGNFCSRKEIDSFLKRNPDFYQINWFRNDEWQAKQLEKISIS